MTGEIYMEQDKNVNVTETVSRKVQKQDAMISIVVYIHNDADGIVEFCERVIKYCKCIFKHLEVIFVDDASSDDSPERIREYCRKNFDRDRTTIIRMGKYRGLEISMNAGRDISIGDFVYEFDSLYIDFPEKVISDVYDRCIAGNDVVIATTQVPLRMTSSFFYHVFNRLIKEKVEGNKLGQESFRILSRRAINRVTAMQSRIPYRKVVYLCSGLSVSKITYISMTGNRPPRVTDSLERFDLALSSFLYFTDFAERICLFLTIVFGIAIIGFSGTLIFTAAMGRTAWSSYLVILLLMSLGLTGLFGVLTFVVKYFSLVLNMMFERQQYAFEDIEIISPKGGN